MGSSNNAYRNKLFGFDVYDLSDIARVLGTLPQSKGGKYTLVFYEGYTFYNDVDVVYRLFDPSKVDIKLLVDGEEVMQEVERLERAFTEHEYKVTVESIEKN